MGRLGSGLQVNQDSKPIVAKHIVIASRFSGEFA
jgi:hypothetical protein